MNDKIRRFAEQMQIEIDNNDHKGNIFEWKDTFMSKISELEYHKAKLIFAVKEGKLSAVKEYIADCANILLSIGDYHDLYREESLNTGQSSEIQVNFTKENISIARLIS